MPAFRQRLAGLGLDLLAAARLPSLKRRVAPSRGVIFTLHRVLPEDPAAFAPNASLQIRPEFLAYAIGRSRELGFDTVGMDEAVDRILSDGPVRPFVAFTFDDAYRDNLQFALPVLRRQKCPFTLFVPTAFVDGVGEPWHQSLEAIIAAETALAVTFGDETEFLVCATTAQKMAAFHGLSARFRAMPEDERRRTFQSLAARYDFDVSRHCRELIMDWDELGEFAAEPLCTIGAHTVHHYALAKLPADQARSEIEQSVRVLNAQLGRAPVHLAYPYGRPDAAGDREYAMVRELGLRSALTTQQRAVRAEDRWNLAALPRVTLRGTFQSKSAFDVMLAPWLLRLVPGYY